MSRPIEAGDRSFEPERRLPVPHLSRMGGLRMPIERVTATMHAPRSTVAKLHLSPASSTEQGITALVAGLSGGRRSARAPEAPDRPEQTAI
jgi:hypothetical protein